YTVWGQVTVGSSFPCGEINGAEDGGILLTATLGSVTIGPVRSSFTVQAPLDTTTRGYSCVRASYFLLTWWVCSTHITPKSNSAGHDWAEEQADAMRNLAYYLNDRAVIVGGDFNRRPTEPGPAGWVNSFAEADSTGQVDTYNNDTAPYKKIDYIFSIRIRTDAAYGIARVGCGSQTASDHCFMHGYLRFL
ncbi:MAG: hypothetical protein JWM47_1221, partial [Acidimicrobiales bacterium]|nr:hypothetical protein [Acidimicrobiales bacterium]